MGVPLEIYHVPQVGDRCHKVYLSMQKKHPFSFLSGPNTMKHPNPLPFKDSRQEQMFLILFWL